MRDERAHAEFFSEGESLAIVVFRLPDIKVTCFFTNETETV